MATPSRIYKQGVVEVSVPASQKIAIQTAGVAVVSKLVGAPNNPGGWAAVGSVNNTHTVFGTFSSSVATTIRIEAGADEVSYEVGAAPEVDLVVSGDAYVRGLTVEAQGAPTALTGSATLTIAQLLTRIITDTHATGATATYTLPTGTLTDAGVDLAIGDSFEWTLINLSAAAADTVTIAAGTDHTVVGVMLVQSAHSTTGGNGSGNAGSFRTRKTAANTYVTYRLG